MKNLKFPCKVCNKSCKSNQNSICCNICNFWLHLKCTSLTFSQFQYYIYNVNIPFFCEHCISESLPLDCLGSHATLSPPITIDDNYLSVNEINKHFSACSYNSKDMTILHINTRSLLKNISQVEEMISVMSNPPEFIAISETKLNKNSNLNFVQITNYQLLNQNSLTFAGGVAIYVKSNVNFTNRMDINFHCIEYESIWIEIISDSNKFNNIILGVLYRHPQGRVKDFTEQFSELLHDISNSKKDIIIVGDLNIDSLKLESNYNIKAYFDMLSSCNFSNKINTPTRMTATSKTSIDHLYCNNSDITIHSSIIVSDISDHFPLLSTIKNRTSITENVSRDKARNYSGINNEKLKIEAHIIMEDLLQTLIKSQNVPTNDQFDLFMARVKVILDSNVPLKCFSRNETRLKMRPWITKGILKSIKTRNKMFKKLCKGNFEDTELHQYFKKYRNKITHLKEISKRNHYEKLLLDTQGNIKKTWNTINKIINKRKSHISLPTQIENGHDTSTDPLFIANTLNTHFATIGSQGRENSIINYKEISNTMKHHQLGSIVLEDTTSDEICNIINSLDQNKACGADEISVSILKKINSSVSPIISLLINNSFKTGIYPECLKLAKVVPIHKGGEKSKPGNYRPISILSIINKIFEKVFYSRLISFLDKNNIINENQFGFRHGYSTTMAVAEFYEKILKSLDSDKMTCAVLLDLSKAFDSVDRKILMYKLLNYGIRGKAWDLMNSYLENRKQFVCAGGIESQLANVNVGVPQGSVLGPLLFILHINDMKSSTQMNVLNFADDTVLYMDFDGLNNVENFINNELEKVNVWMETNHLRINASKTKYMIFAPNNEIFSHASNIKLKIGKSLHLEQVDEYKYLGLIIDSKLTWNSHIQRLHSKLSQSLGILYRCRHYLNKKSLILLFHSLFSTHLNYGILCWGRCGGLKSLQIIVNKAIRCINFLSYRDNVSHYYYKDNFMPIDDIYKLELGKFMFKFNKNLLPSTFNNYFQRASSVHHHLTRYSKNNYFVPQSKKNSGLKCLSSLGTDLWSGIPDSLKAKNELSSFVNNYKELLKVKYNSNL